MSAKLQILGIDKLSVAERIALVQEIWDSIAAEVEEAPLTEAQQVEVDRRMAFHRANPQAAIPWEQVEAEALARSINGCLTLFPDNQIINWHPPGNIQRLAAHPPRSPFQ